jgi:hypothetical protein
VQRGCEKRRNTLRLVSRNIATWLIALAVVLFVVDGTRTLSEQRVVITSIGEAWTTIEQITTAHNAPQREAQGAGGTIWGPFVAPLAGLPGWLVFGLPGLLLAAASRRNGRRYSTFDNV